MRKRLTFFEYDGFIGADDQRTDDRLDHSGLSQNELKHLDWFSRRYANGESVFQITQSSIRAQQFVGTVCIGNKELQVLPKLLRKRETHEQTQILKNLFFILEYVNQIEGIDSGAQRLGENTGSFIEIYVNIFANRLLRLLLKNPPKFYVTEYENLKCVRGKIALTEHIKQNFVDQSKIFCEFDEFTMNNIFNQTFRFVSNQLLHLTQVGETRKLLTRVIGLLSDIDDRVISYDSIKNLVVPHRAKDLNAVFSLAKLFLRYLSADVYTGRANSVAVLFDMNELFENFVFHILNRNCKQLGLSKVHFQKGKRLVHGVREIGASDFDNKSLFNTFQDIVLDFDSGKRLVIDTKYKLIGDKRSHFGIANTDVYQMLAYKELNSNEEGATIALIYPENEEKMGLEFKINSLNDVRFSASTINLSCDLSAGVQPLVDEFYTLFKNLKLVTE
jgi:5-methylcytosine-specific restriction enzyme subunit McrC